MYCPTCGEAEQNVNSFCRRCGERLLDYELLAAKAPTPEKHLKANLILSVMTAVVSAGLATALYIRFLGEESTPFVIYLTAGFLTAMCAWQVQVVWRTVAARRLLNGPRMIIEDKTADFAPAETRKLHAASERDDLREYREQRDREKIRR